MECVELHTESVGIQGGTYLELVWNWLVNQMFSSGNVWGMHRGCWGMSGELIRDYYELFGKQLIFVWLLENALGIRREFLRIIWETVGIHREPLENLWGLLVKNSFVGRGPNTNRAHPHACNIPCKTALPVPCTHRFIFNSFLVTF